MLLTVFELVFGEYYECIDLWLGHQLISFAAVRAVAS